MHIRGRLGKVLLSLAIGFSTVALTPWAGPVKAAPSVQIQLDGYPLPFPASPVVIEGTTLVPFRAISEALGIKVTWNAKTQQIIGQKQVEQTSKQVTLTLGSRIAFADRQKVTLAVAPRSIKGNTMIPLSFFSQQFGANVKWNAQTQTVSIVSPKESMYTLGFYALGSFWERKRIADLNAVAFGWSRIDDQGNFTLTGKEYQWPEAAGDITPEKLITDAAAGETSPYLMVYSVDSKLELTTLISNASKRQAAAKQITDTASEKGFKGVLLDMEGLGLTGEKKAAQNAYTAFVKEIVALAHASGLKVALALHPLNGAYKGYDYSALGKTADELIIMAYAYGDQKSPEPTNKVDEAIKLAMKEVDKRKLVLGISLASEQADSVNAKIGLAKRYDLKGIALWRLGLKTKEAVWNAMEQSIEFRS
ncbi:glycosyl hydrolase [Paenibacillus sp. CAA11]|uniref:stalk domain-containing protein n=1 Tax=Paenibacillus sp. CAA11 TaxID=1532905 RepID=UPI000D38E68E|nr:stalk domain-containing protein [Paenibacillus sp. CAA11]AWB42892.1 glycosyl hydrolase [Paenibacillus sp. CAA11]